MKRILVVLHNDINYMCVNVFISIISFSEERCPHMISCETHIPLLHIMSYTMIYKYNGSDWHLWYGAPQLIDKW